MPFPLVAPNERAARNRLVSRHALAGLALCLWGTASLLAQTEQDDEVIAQARRLYAEEGPRAALPEFERALAMYRQAQDRRGEAITLGYIGNCYKRFGELPRALEYLQQALVMKQELEDRLEEGKTLSHLGLVYWEMAEYGAAIEHLSRSLAIAEALGERELQAAALNNLGLVYDEQGDYRRSLEQYGRALELQRAVGSAAGESATLGNIGGVHLLLGRYREAMTRYEQALEISERLHLKASASQDLGNIALCHLGMGQPAEALAAFDRALVLAREAGLKKEEADWRKGKGSAFLGLGKYDEALGEYREALRAYEESGLKRERVEALNDSGELYLLLGDVASAEAAFRAALELARGIGHPRGLTASLLALSDLELRRGRPEEAAALCRDALGRAREADDRQQVVMGLLELALTQRVQGRPHESLVGAREALELARAMDARLLTARALHALGEAARALGRPAEALEHYAAGEGIAQTTGDPDLGWRIAFGQGQALEALGRREEAVAAYKQAVETIESVRTRLRAERFRAGYIEDKYQVYVALLRLLLEMERPGEAFLFGEGLRSRRDLELLERGPEQAETPAEGELRGRIRQLQRALEEESEKPAAERRKPALDLFTGELVAAEREYQTLLDDLRGRRPDHASSGALPVPTCDQVQRLLPADTALVEYVVGEEDLAIFVLTHQTMRAVTVHQRSADLRTKVELLRDLIVREGTEDWLKPAESLRRTLLGPVEGNGWLRGVRRLYFVPHGTLHYVPFAALPRRDGKGLRYLVEDYEIGYLPAAAALTRDRPGRDGHPTLLALAPARARLPYALQEAQGLAELFPGSHRVLVGRRATEASFKRAAPDYRVIHLATHGYFNKMNPLFSGLELEKDQQDNGRLEVHEILGLRLDADLVTLSACETALGSGQLAENPAGDDFVGLTRAFLAAGSDAVLATLWEVNDRSTLRFMRRFYASLPRVGRAAALALAQRSLCRSPGRLGHPYFWAPFVLVGDMG